MQGDGRGMVILKLGYNELIVPAKAATVFMEFIANGGIYKLESKWMQDVGGKNGTTVELVEPAECEIKHLPIERVALAKLGAATYKQYQEDKARKEQA